MPYVTAVLIDAFEEGTLITRLHATIVVEKDSQKPIVIGAGGARLKEIGTEAREELEKLFPPKVYLELFVKVAAALAQQQRRHRRTGLPQRRRFGGVDPSGSSSPGRPGIANLAFAVDGPNGVVQDSTVQAIGCFYALLRAAPSSCHTRAGC